MLNDKTMSIDVKICGLKTVDAVEAALNAGAAYIGLVFFQKSPRYVNVETAAMLANRVRGRAKIVVLLVDPDDDKVSIIVNRVQPDLIQLHGSETPERAFDIRAKFGVPVIKAVSIADADDVLGADQFSGSAELILFDAKPPEGMADALPGGNGIPFDWRMLKGIDKNMKFILSGGLNPDNVRSAIELTGASVVDVSSGVERAPGEKDPDLIRHFIREAQLADPTRLV